MGFKNVANASGGFESLKKTGLPVVAKEKKIIIFLLHLKQNQFYLDPRKFYCLQYS